MTAGRIAAYFIVMLVILGSAKDLWEYALSFAYPFNIYNSIVYTIILFGAIFSFFSGHGLKETDSKGKTKDVYKEPFTPLQVWEIASYPNYVKSFFIFAGLTFYFGLLGIAILAIIFH